MVCMTDHIQEARLGKHPTNPCDGEVVLCLTDHIMGRVRWIRLS
jgi:hypothetical protein